MKKLVSTKRSYCRLEGVAASRGLVDAVGGISQAIAIAIAIAKQKANIPKAKSQVTLVEISRPSTTPLELLSCIGSTQAWVDMTLKGLLQDVALFDEVQARMDGILFQTLEDSSAGSPVRHLIKDYLSQVYAFFKWHHVEGKALKNERFRSVIEKMTETIKGLVN